MVMIDRERHTRHVLNNMKKDNKTLLVCCLHYRIEL